MASGLDIVAVDAAYSLWRECWIEPEALSLVLKVVAVISLTSLHYFYGKAWSPTMFPCRLVLHWSLSARIHVDTNL